MINLFAKENEDQEDEEEQEQEHEEQEEEEEEEEEDYFEEVRCTAWVNSALLTSHISLLNTTLITPCILTPPCEYIFKKISFYNWGQKVEKVC